MNWKISTLGAMILIVGFAMACIPIRIYDLSTNQPVFYFPYITLGLLVALIGFVALFIGLSVREAKRWQIH
jgi:hypothetical protein